MVLAVNPRLQWAIHIVHIQEMKTSDASSHESSEYLNTRPLVCDKWIWPSDRLLFSLLGQMGKLKFQKTIRNIEKFPTYH